MKIKKINKKSNLKKIPRKKIKKANPRWTSTNVGFSELIKSLIEYRELLV